VSRKDIGMDAGSQKPLITDENPTNFAIEVPGESSGDGTDTDTRWYSRWWFLAVIFALSVICPPLIVVALAVLWISRGRALWVKVLVTMLVIVLSLSFVWCATRSIYLANAYHAPTIERSGPYLMESTSL